MASVRKREWEHNGVKKTAWVVEYTDPFSGKRKRFTPKSGLKKDADRECLRIQNEVEAGTHTAASDALTVGQIVEMFLRYTERRAEDGQIGKGSFVRHRAHIDLHILPRFGRLKMKDMTPTMIEDFYYDLRKEGRKPNSIKAIFATLRMAEEHAFKTGKVRQTMVTTAMKAIKPPATGKIKTFAAEDIRKLLSAPRLAHVFRMDCCLRGFVHIAACCGLRFGEIAGLTVPDIDIEGRVIHVRHNMTMWGVHKGPKTAAGIRDVPMPDNVAAVLEEWMSKYHLANDLNLVFCTPKRNQYFNPNIRRAFKDALKMVGLSQDYHFHALRHFAASWMVHHHIPLTDVAQMLGHNKFDMTLQVYAHPVADGDHRHAAMKRMVNGLKLDAPTERQGELTT